MSVMIDNLQKKTICFKRGKKTKRKITFRCKLQHSVCLLHLLHIQYVCIIHTYTYTYTYNIHNAAIYINVL